MPEQKGENKKPALVKRILRWIWLGFLVILLIASIIFQAPWKVIILLLVFLLAATALPKPLRKWFWRTAGVVIIVLVVWIFLPDRNGDWKPYTFDEELAALEAKYTIPDSENAAVIYNKLLADYDANTFKPNFPDDLRFEPWSSEGHPQAAQWRKDNESTITTLLEVSRIEKCRFQIQADPLNLDQSMARLSKMRGWTYALCIAGSNDMGEGRIDQALEKYTALLQIAKHLYQQPRLVDLLVAIAIEQLAIKQLNRFVVTGDTKEAHLSLIEQALADIKHDWCSVLPPILEYEKLFTKNFLSLFYQINPKGKTRLSRNPFASTRAQLPKEVPPPTYWEIKLIKAYMILGWFFVPRTPQEAARIIDAAY